MIQQLTTIYQNQEKLKNRWKILKNKYIAAIYGGVLEHKTAKEIHKELYDMAINPPKKLLAYAMKVTNKAVKLDKGKGKYNNLDLLAIPLLNLFTKNAVNYKANIFINQEIREIESVEKEKTLDWTWKNGRSNGKIFYVASSHKDCAKDHKDWQGKIYVDRYWHNYDKDGSIEKYIKDHNIRTVQWVTGPPVYFLTRPYCRHYFTQYNFEDIVNNKYHIPKKKVGDRRLQTPTHATIEYYKDRLKMLQGLYTIRSTTLLENQINKTKILIAKWNQYLKGKS